MLMLMLFQGDNQNDNELDDLDAEANMPIEELLAKYVSAWQQGQAAHTTGF